MSLYFKQQDNSTQMSELISFAEIVQGRDSSVRVTDDGLLDVVEIVMVVTGKDCNQANETLRNLKPSLFDKEKIVLRSGRRYATPKDTIALIMVLPGKIAKEIRSQFAAIIEDYITKNVKLCSGSFIIHSDPDNQETRRKRIKREDLELVNLEQEIQEKRIQNLRNFMGLMTQIRPDWMQTDARFRLKTEYLNKNIIVAPTVQALTNGESESGNSLSISQLAQELGCKPLSHADTCSAGKLTAKRYRDLHKTDPAKHRQWVDGAERTVNSYTEADRGLLTAVLTDLGLVKNRSS